MPPLEEFDPTEDTPPIGIYGDNGSGKTHLACTAPGKKIFIDYLGNLQVTKKFPNEPIRCIRGPEKWDDIEKMWTDPIFDWAEVVILDNMTGLYRTLVEQIVATVQYKKEARPLKEVPILGDYGLAAERLRVAVGNGFIKKLGKERKKRVIAICHTMEKKDKEGSIIGGGPALPGQVPAYILSLFPEFISLYVEGNDRVARYSKKGLHPGFSRVRDGQEVRNPDLSKLYDWPKVK